MTTGSSARGLAPHLAAAALGIVVAVSLALAAGRFGDAMPQVATGGDALSVAFGDAKAAISLAMVRKADSYFHGGIDMDCGDAHGHRQGQAHDHEGDHGHDDDHGHVEGDVAPARDGCDPWRWINARVRAPEVHRHLERAEAVELMPWFWAAVKADPHNADAWTTAMYVAERMLKDVDLARRIAGEARAKNPDSLEIACAAACLEYGGGHGDVQAAEALFERVRSIGKAKCGGRLGELNPHDAEEYCRALDYLSKIMADRGDSAGVQRLLDEARSTGIQTPVLDSISRRLP